MKLFTMTTFAKNSTRNRRTEITRRM